MQPFITDTATANWVIVVILTVVGVLLLRILNKIEAKLENHEGRIAEAETDIAVLKSKE